MADKGRDTLGEDILPSRRPANAPAGGSGDQPAGADAGSGGATGDAGATVPQGQPRTAAELDETITGLERAVSNLQRGVRWYSGGALAAAGFGIVIGAIVAFVVADYTVGRYESRLAAAANAQISEIRKAAATERVKINVEAGNKLAEIKEAATRAAAARATAEKAPAQAEAPAKAESEKPAAEAPKTEGAPATAVAPAPAAQAPAAQTADDRLKTALERIQRATKKGGK